MCWTRKPLRVFKKTSNNLLTKNNIKSRLQYATKNLDRPVELWKNVLWIDVTNSNFSDPSAVCLVQTIKAYEWKTQSSRSNMEIDQSFYGVVLLLQKWTSWLYEGHHGFLEVSWKHQAILAKNLMLLVHRLKLEDNWTSSGAIIPNYTYKSPGASFRDVIKCSQLMHQCNTQIIFRIQICICYKKN